jgi:cytochrome c biogenesis protein CcmG, thiol:disulfide interchange protein DsbE
MRRLLTPAFALLAAAALLGLLAYGVSHQGTSSSIQGQVAKGELPAAPDATMALPILGASAKESLADLRGKVVVLNVFASWCPPCAAEAPILEREQHLLAGHDATVLGVTYQDNASDSEAFVREWHLTYPVLRDVNGNFVRAYQATGVPETFVIDRRGRVAAVRPYQLDDTWLAQTVPSILARRS